MQELTQRAGEETVDAVPVVAEAHPVERRPAAPAPVAQAAAVAATGFIAGVAAVTVLRHRGPLRRLLGGRRRRHRLGPVVASRTFLVRVDVLGERGR